MITYIRAVTTLVHLTVNGKEIITTVDHPYYVKGKGFVNAGELAIGNELLDSSGNILFVENFDVEIKDQFANIFMVFNKIKYKVMEVQKCKPIKKKQHSF